jgi:hypothetical protein
MNKDKLIILSFVLSWILPISGAFMLINHIHFAHYILLTGVVSILFLIILCLLEISNSSKIDKSSKFLWFFGLLTFPTLAGLLYILSIRKKL